MYEQQSLLTADLDEIIDATGHNDAQPQEPPPSTITPSTRRRPAGRTR